MKYTYEVLQAAVRESSNMTEVMRALDVPPSGGMHTHLRRRIIKLGIDTSHFTAKKPRRYSRELLTEAVRQSTSIADVMCLLGVEPHRSNKTNMRRRLARFNIDISHFSDNGGTRAAPSRGRMNLDAIFVVRPAASARAKPDRLRGALLQCGVSEECVECGVVAEWEGRPLSLHVDHINGDYQDCRRSNLRFLCPNCHSQTRNYAGRGKALRRRATPKGPLSGEVSPRS